MSLFSLKDKTAVITGAASGIGRSITKVFAQQQAKVYALDLNEKEITDYCKQLKKDGLDVSPIICDITQSDGVMKKFEWIAKDCGQINILVNSAGISHIGNIEDTSPEDLDKVFNVNVKGTYNCMRAAVNHMKSGGGVILNIASVAASVGIQQRFGYSMSKGAVISMTLSVAKDYLANKIRCNSISPARIHTPFVDGFLEKNYPGKEKEMFQKLEASQPIGRMGKPEEVATLALYLCSDEASFITGCDYVCDGGFTKLNN